MEINALSLTLSEYAGYGIKIFEVTHTNEGEGINPVNEVYNSSLLGLTYNNKLDNVCVEVLFCKFYF